MEVFASFGADHLMLTMRGASTSAQGGSPAGDLLVTPRIVLPDTVGSELEAAARQLKEERPYSPRAGLDA